MDKLKALRDALEAAAGEMRSAADAYAANDDTEQETRLWEAFNEAQEAHKRAKTELDKAERIEEARQAQPAPDPEPEIRVIREPLTYERHKPQDSYFLDIARTEFGRGDVEGARARLKRHAQEMKVELEQREARRARAFDAGLETLLRDSGLPPHIVRALEEYGLSEKRDITRVDGAGGEFVPPLWLLDRYAEAARAGRPFADAMGSKIPLPAGTDSINIPRITTGSLTGVQTADNAAVTEQDIVTNSVNAPVRTIAGQQDVAMQLLEQSPIGFDEVIFKDLIADHAMQLDAQLINGSGAAGQLLGILNVVGVNAITYTDATPTVPELYPKLGDALNQASNNRKRVPTHFWMHGRRWFWAATQVDSSSRPFFVSLANGPQNAIGVQAGSYNEGGPVTAVIGVPIWLDLNIPTNLGAGTNEDRVIASKMDDHVLFEGEVRSRVLKEVLSGTLTVRLQVYSYVAGTCGRFPAATSVVAGTGLVTPTF